MLQNRIESFLLKIGVAPNLSGFRACAYAIDMIIRDPDVMGKITARLYPEVGKKMGKTAAQIERNIRHAAVSIFDHQDYEAIVDMLGGINPNTKKGKFTNSQFLGLCAVKIAAEYAKEKGHG